MKQCIEECVKVSCCRICKQCNIFLFCLFAKFPHFIPCLRNFPAFFLEQSFVVEQSARSVEHRHQICFSVSVRICNRVVHKSRKDLVFYSYILSRYCHFQYVSHFLYVIVLNKGFCKSRFRSHCSHDNIRIITGFHSRCNDIFKLLVDCEFYLYSRICLFKFCANIFPHILSICGFYNSQFQSLLFICHNSCCHS